MWIDNRTQDIKVYETRPTDPYIKKMTWVPEENAWVLFSLPTPVEYANYLASSGDPEFVRQAKVMNSFGPDDFDYAKMRMNCG
jgi:hypothetical protein